MSGHVDNIVDQKVLEFTAYAHVVRTKTVRSIDKHI
jgi:hypothetical protein